MIKGNVTIAVVRLVQNNVSSQSHIDIFERLCSINTYEKYIYLDENTHYLVTIITFIYSRGHRHMTSDFWVGR